LDAVGGDQKVGDDLTSSVFEARCGATVVLLHSDKRAAMTVDVASAPPQTPPNAIPRRQHLGTRNFANHVAVPRQHDAALDRDAELATSPGREGKRLMQFVMGGNARAARAEFLARTLVDGHGPANLAEEQPREQSTDRPADDDGTFSQFSH
jgi:hypothetical protein